MSVSVYPTQEAAALQLPPRPYAAQRVFVQDQNKLFLPAGSLSLSGVVTANNIPVNRTVRLYDWLTGELLDETTSSSGVYSFSGISDRTDGFTVLMVGNLGLGERDAVVPGVHPS